MPVRQLVLIPSFNSGFRLFATVTAALRADMPVWVVIDGSDDGSAAALGGISPDEARLRVFHRKENGGKGAAVFEGLRAAAAAGFSHVLVMDADGQHKAEMIPEFLALSRMNPEAMILGVPVFDASAPWVRKAWRRISNALVRLETKAAIGDSLFGFRVYPVVPLLEVMARRRSMRRFDFDAEAVVRLAWRGVRPINVPAPVRYFRADEGGVSHFRYWRDNWLLAGMHARLLAERSMFKAKIAGRKALLFVNKKKQKNFTALDRIPFTATGPIHQKFFGYFFSKK